MGFLAPAMPFISAGMGALGGLFGGKSKSNVDQGWYGFKPEQQQQWGQAYNQMGTLAGQQNQMAGQWTQPALDNFLKASAQNAKWAQSVRDPAAEAMIRRQMEAQKNYMDPMTQRSGARSREVGEIGRTGFGNMFTAGQQRQQQAVGQLGQLAGMGGQLGQGFSQLSGQTTQAQLQSLLGLGQQGVDMQRLAAMEKQMGLQAGQGLGAGIFGGLSQVPWDKVFGKKKPTTSGSGTLSPSDYDYQAGPKG